MSSPVDRKEPLLEVQDLRVAFGRSRARPRSVPVRGVSFALRRGEILGVVGESGCGKSLTARALLGLVGRRPGEHVDGQALYRGGNLLDLPERAFSRLRGRRLAMVLQDPMTSLNPLYRVGAQVAEVPRLHEGDARAAAWRRAVTMLEKVGIDRAGQRAGAYPHEFSGGMRQRAVIAMGLVCSPDLLIADEPTTALDVTVQAQILDLLRRLRSDTGSAILFITHDLSVVGELCDRVLVMYAGRVVEEAETARLFAQPTHPYTRALLASVPTLDTSNRLEPIPGQPPDPARMPDGCPFHPRCPLAVARCREDMPPALGGTGHRAACWESEVPDA